ncbi:hypothetical protein DB347_01690 [Opitutaceae bacterium EW11]|nr:hypothetical protein DB347_01690 [Opitutaceae bacterium EW11]
MWQKLKEQIPTVVITVVLICGAAYWIHQKTVSDMAAREQTALDALREQHAAELRASAEETQKKIDAVQALLNDAIKKRAADALMTDEEFAKVNADKVNQLAEAIATKMQPYNPLPKTPEDAERLQNEQVDKVSSRMADKIQPILSEMAKDQNLTRDAINSYSQRISDQIGAVLTAELAKNQQLNNNLAQTQAIARDSLRLSHEVTALYLSSFKDQGLITRLLSLPANVVRDATSLSIVNSTERRKMEERLVSQMNEIEKRLNDVQAQTPRK